MPNDLSPRLQAIVDALPLRQGMRVIEIGCGPGAMAREIARRIEPGFVLGLDRSDRAIAQFESGAERAGITERVEGRVGAIECFELEAGEEPFDLAVAIRVGAFDGRHPALEAGAIGRVFASLKPGGRFFIDGGAPLLEIERTKTEVG